MKLKAFAERLKRLRLALGMSQDDLSKHMKLSRSAISMWERGLREPDYDTIVMLANVFQVTPQYLVGWIDDPSAEALKKQYQEMDERFERWLEVQEKKRGEGEEKKEQRMPNHPQLTVLFSRSRRLSDSQLEAVNRIVAEMVKEEEPYDD